MESQIVLSRVEQINNAVTAGNRSLYEALTNYRLAGELLLAQKQECEHGEYEQWIKDNFSFSKSTADRYVTLAEGWHILEQYFHEQKSHAWDLSLRQAEKMIRGANKPQADSGEDSGNAIESTNTIDAPYSEVETVEDGTYVLPTEPESGVDIHEFERLKSLESTYEKELKVLRERNQELEAENLALKQKLEQLHQKPSESVPRVPMNNESLNDLELPVGSTVDSHYLGILFGYKDSKHFIKTVVPRWKVKAEKLGKDVDEYLSSELSKQIGYGVWIPQRVGTKTTGWKRVS